ncbi:kinase-like domain-containing protein [Rhizophagus clarus]|uniref:Kinase-like domain-containing protein n=1 Tax=Rhizophagus clarus TaxID=94130 RepID=A0A8H3QKS7_9GLOM|nr:kinase-like domain-containing protein [Rhizophagus clarus]
MSTIRKEFVYAAINRANMLIDYNIYDDIHKQNKFMQHTILLDNSLTDDERDEAIKILNIDYDRNKVRSGGFSEIYTSTWIDGEYEEWDSKNHQLIKSGTIDVVLKSLENVESADQSWFKEAISHLTIGNIYEEIVRCNGLTRNPSNGNYMLVIDRMDNDLRNYLRLNYNKITWKEKIKITYEITNALWFIHKENAIHRDLHSGNILYSEINDSWYISDLGFCGPVDKPSKSIYGNLPYIAPEVIAGKEFTFASDIYSVAMLMWEISSGQPPFIHCENDYYLAMNIINGMRPRIGSEIPLKYRILMEQCWNAIPSERLDIYTLCDEMSEIHLLCQDRPDELTQSKAKEYPEINEISSNYTSSRLFTSKVHQFENFPEPKNATEEEQEAFHSSKSYSFNIPYNVEDFGSKILKDNNKSDLSKEFNKLQINDNQNNYNGEKILSQQMMKHYIDTDDENEIYNNPNLHSEEQDELNIPDDI